MRTSFIGRYVQERPRIQKTSTTPVGVRTFDGKNVVPRDAIFYVDPTWSRPSGGAPDGYYPMDFEISGLSLRGADPTSSIAVFFEQGSGLHVHDSDISNVRHAFLGRNVWSSSFARIKSSGRWDVQVGGTSLKFELVASGGSPAGFDGFHLRGVTYSSFVNTTSDNYSQTAYSFTNCKGIVMIAPGAEAGTAEGPGAGSMFEFNGGNVMTVIGAFSATKAGSSSPIISASSRDTVTFLNADLSAVAGPSPALTDVLIRGDARLTFMDSVFSRGPDAPPKVTFERTTTTPGSLVVLRNGQQTTYRNGAAIRNELEGATITAAPGTDALSLPTGARLSLGSARVLEGNGVPEGRVAAPVGSLYVRTDGTRGATLYVKEQGVGNTGWVAK
jgi:hypothetical protein